MNHNSYTVTLSKEAVQALDLHRLNEIDLKLHKMAAEMNKLILERDALRVLVSNNSAGGIK